MNRKLLLLLVFLVGLYLLSVWFGMRQEPAKNGGFKAPDWAASLGNDLVTKARLSPDHIRFANPPACLNGLKQGSLALNAGQSCTFVIAKAGGLLGGSV